MDRIVRAHAKLNVPSDLIVNSFLAEIDRVAARGYVPSTGKSFDLPFSRALTGCLQMIFFTHAFRRWASPNIFSMCLYTAKLSLGTFTMLVAHGDNGIPGCLILTRQMRSFLSRQSAHLIRCVRSGIQLLSHVDAPYFGQYLEEDPRTNRIDDSLQLFTAICSNQLLKNIHLVLFLSRS